MVESGLGNPDGVVYVAPTKEVWVTVPGDKSVRIHDSQTLSQKEKLTFEGQPEGYAVDAKRGRLYMNYAPALAPHTLM